METLKAENDLAELQIFNLKIISDYYYLYLHCKFSWRVTSQSLKIRSLLYLLKLFSMFHTHVNLRHTLSSDNLGYGNKFAFVFALYNEP